MTPIPRRVVLATRGSALALAQTELVATTLRRIHPDLEIDIKKVSTKGDKDRRPFVAIGGKGLFVAEVERAITDGEADAAVHSAKDLTLQIDPRCAIVCIPERAAVHDVVIGGEGEQGSERLGSLPPGARVGTSSMRRRALLAEARPDVEAIDFRGNVDTRVRKVEEGEVDAAIVARAGLERLGRTDAHHGSLDPEWWVPAPGQGTLVVEALSDRSDLAALFEPLDDPVHRAELIAERAFAFRLEGGCSIPLGCFARASEERLTLTGYLGHPAGGSGLRDRISGGVDEGEALGLELAEAILGAGGDDLLEELRATPAPEVPAP